MVLSRGFSWLRSLGLDCRLGCSSCQCQGRSDCWSVVRFMNVAFVSELQS